MRFDPVDNSGKTLDRLTGRQSVINRTARERFYADCEESGSKERGNFGRRDSANHRPSDPGEIVRTKELPVLERLTKAILPLNVESRIGVEMMEQVHRPQNALMHQKMQATLLAGIHPILTELVEEGIQQGIFPARYPESAVEVTILYANTAFDTVNAAGLRPAQRERKQTWQRWKLRRSWNRKPGSELSILF